MSERPPIRIPAGQHAPPMDLRAEAAAFKMPPETVRGSRTVLPDSVEWHELHMDRRLEVAPFLGGLLRSGKARLVYTEQFTSTCEEKAAAAMIPLEATVKAVFCKDMFSPADKFVVVASGKGRLSFSGLDLPGDYEYSQLETAAREDLPHGMEFGTCSAFISPLILDSLALVIIEDPETELRGKKGRPLGKLGDLEGDFSIGGTDSTAHHLSVRMNYREFAAAMLEEYGGKAVLSSIGRSC